MADILHKTYEAFLSDIPRCAYCERRLSDGPCDCGPRVVAINKLSGLIDLQKENEALKMETERLQNELSAMQSRFARLYELCGAMVKEMEG